MTHHGDPDPDLLRRRDLLRQRHALRPRRHHRRDPLPLREGRASASSGRLDDRDVRLKESLDSSHARASSTGWTVPPPGSSTSGARAGCSARSSRGLGHYVVGVDVITHPEVKERIGRVLRGRSRPRPAGWPAHRLRRRHLRRRARTRAPTRASSCPSSRPSSDHGGHVIASVPNFGHWYPRPRTALGRFDYDQRGILDQDHVRFFTRRSFRRLCDRSGWEVVRSRSTGVPLELLTGSRLARAAGNVERVARDGVAHHVRLPVPVRARSRTEVTRGSRSRALCLVVVLVGVAVRLLLWWRSIGTNDAATWLSHGRHVAQLGLNGTYERMRLFNHPPLDRLLCEVGLGALRRRPPSLRHVHQGAWALGRGADPLGAVAMGEPSGRRGVCVPAGGDPRVGLPRQHRLPDGGLRPLRGDRPRARSLRVGRAAVRVCAERQDRSARAAPAPARRAPDGSVRWRGSPLAASSGCSPSFRPSSLLATRCIATWSSTSRSRRTGD